MNNLAFTQPLEFSTSDKLVNKALLEGRYRKKLDGLAEEFDSLMLSRRANEQPPISLSQAISFQANKFAQTFFMRSTLDSELIAYDPEEDYPITWQSAVLIGTPDGYKPWFTLRIKASTSDDFLHAEDIALFLAYAHLGMKLDVTIPFGFVIDDLQYA